MNVVKEEAESEGSSPAPSRRLDACEGDEDEEESMAGSVLHVSLHAPPSTAPPKGSFAELQRTFSAVAWCAKSSLLACATEVCAKDSRSNSPLMFWIPVHIIHPERPTEHAVFYVDADTLCDYVQFLEWSPASCTRALLVGTSSGRVTIWTQPLQGGANAAQALNCWKCEHEWRQDQAVCTKWLSGVAPYRWTPTGGGLSKPSFEDRFLSHQFRAPVRWPNFLCVCSVSLSGCVCLHWCQWPPLGDISKQNWFATKQGVLGSGRLDLISADAIVNESGVLLIAGVPIGSSSSVVIWEVKPLFINSQETTHQIILGLASWPGIASLPAVLLNWHEGLGNDMKGVTDSTTHLPGVEVKAQNFSANMRCQQPFPSGDDADAPMVHCCPVSYLSACVTPETGQPTVIGWGSGVSAVAFDPSKGGSVLVVLLNEGRHSLLFPDEGSSFIGYKVQRWESSQQQVAAHPLFEPAVPMTYSSSSPPTSTTIWRSTADKSISAAKKGETSSSKNCNEPFGNVNADQPTTVKTCSKIVFSAHGGELAVVTASGDVHVYSGSSLTPIDNYYLKVGILCAAPSFSPTGCCLSTVWHDIKRDCSVLKILRVYPPAIPVMQGTNSSSNWERGLADRFWWSLVAEVDWWDAVGCTQSAVEENIVTFHKVIAVLDTDFHSLPLLSQRQHYGPALDRIKCRMLEGVDGSDVRAVVLDMQARLLLEMLGKGIEAALINPATFIEEPWMASSETLIGLVHDVMTVEPALISYIQPYIDAVLDLASHFLTRLRRYASFCRTLATHAAGNAPLNAGNTRLPTTPSNPTGSTAASSQGPQAAPSGSGSNGATSVQAWVQGAIAKVNNSTEGAVSLTTTGTTGTVAPLQLSVSQATFPGMPAVRLVGDCNFLHRLCQLLLFCFIFRRRQQTRGVPTVPRNLDGMDGSEEPGAGRSVRLGSGNAGQGYTSDEVKFLFLVSVTLCKKTSSLPHPMPKSQIGSATTLIRLHYPDGQYSVAPEVVEASLGQHIQHLPRPRGADSAGLLMRELELHPPAEDWSKRNLFGGPWAGALELCSPLDEKENHGMNYVCQSPAADFLGEEFTRFRDLWPRKRRFAERDTAFGLRTAVSMGSFTGFMGSRRDTITTVWKNSPHGIWHKCVRCGRQTVALAKPNTSTHVHSTVDAWWTGRWMYACPICGGSWIRVV